MAQEQEDSALARELFDMYVGMFDREFYDIESAKEAHQQTFAIASELLELGFIIRTKVIPSVKTINPTEDAIQTVISIKFNMALIERGKETEKPLAINSAISHIFGPITAITHKHVEYVVSPEDEAWLHRQLDSIK